MSKLEDLIEKAEGDAYTAIGETFNTIRNDILGMPNLQKELADKIIRKLEEFMDEYKEYEDWTQLDDGLIHQGWFECANYLLNFINTGEVSDE